MTTNVIDKLPDYLWSDLLGVPFLRHGRDEKCGMDCLGLVLTVTERMGVDFPDPLAGLDVPEAREPSTY